MNPEVVLKIDALDNTKAAFSSVKNGLSGLEKNTSSFRDKVQNLQPAFQKMAAVGTVAFAAVGAGVYKATQSAAVAEGSWNKFNTVFGEGADEMRAFIDDIRKEMPTATHEIARMGADLQDLLVPMGLAREDAQGLTRGFLDLANKVAAFNDVDPTEVLEAFKSGLSGSSEPLRRFGINALDSSIELEAMETGLLKAGEKLMDLDPITRSQVKAQALLTLSVKQSSDAINGFEVNNDSLIRRQQDLQARTAELSVILGNMFLPILDNVVKAILPVVTRFAEWTEANPRLAQNLVIAAGAIAGVVAVVGALGLLLPPIIGGFALLAAGIGALSLPIIAITALLGVIGVTMFNLWKNWDESWTSIKWAASNAWEWIREKAIDPMIQGFEKVLRFIERVRDGLKSIGAKVGSSVSSAGSSISRLLGSVTPFADGGIVTKPTLGLVGEAGPEAIIPLTKAGALGGGGITINIAGTFMDDRAAARRMGDEIMNTLKQQMRL